MSEVVRPFAAESVSEFIRRHGGIASTANIAGRFGWEVRDAKRRLDLMARQGVLVKHGPTSMRKTAAGSPYAGICSWSIRGVDPA